MTRIHGARRLLIALLLGPCFLAACDREPTGIPGESDCRSGNPLAMDVGDQVVDRSGAGRFCLESGSGGTYLMVPFVSGPRDTLTKSLVRVYGSGLGVPPTTADVASTHATESDRLAVPSDALRLLEGHGRVHRLIDARGRVEAQQLLAGPVEVAVGAAPVLRPSLGRVPAAGDVMLINVAASCEEAERDLRAGRVVAVSREAIVVTDPDNPTRDPFTDAQLAEFGRAFDDVVAPTLTEAFGPPTDLDGNGRVILFFTRAVNEIVPPGGGAGLAIGFFYRGDVFPRGGIPGRTIPCAGSNEAEILYLAVPDPDGEVRGVPVKNSTLDLVALGTIGHEFQHLVNTSRRLHVTEAPVLEETWLNEGLSHIAEELLFYTAAGLTPRADLGPADVTAEPRRTEAFTRFMYNNLGRLDAYLQSPHDRSLMGTDGSATRGAAWSFLRYAADRHAGDDGVLFRTLAEGPLAGLANLEYALGADPLPWMEDWSVGLFLDDFLTGIEARHRFPSWRLRDLIAALRVIDQRYPLRVLPLGPGEGFSMRMSNGAAAYPVFTIDAGVRALAVVDAPDLGLGRALHTTLTRVR